MEGEGKVNLRSDIMVLRTLGCVGECVRVNQHEILRHEWEDTLIDSATVPSGVGSSCAR